MRQFLFLFLFTLSVQAENYKLYLFASSTCEKCHHVKTILLPEVLTNFSNVSYEHIPVDDVKNFELLMKYEDLYKNEKDHSVKAFIGKKCLSGVKEIESGLTLAISKMIKDKFDTPSPERVRSGEVTSLSSQENKSHIISPSNSLIGSPRDEKVDISKDVDLVGEEGLKDGKQGKSLLDKKFDTLTFWTVLLAGLGDGINPCAFVTLVFLISVLSNLKKSSRDIIAVGISFSAAVFITYLLLGFGILQVVKKLSVETGISEYLNYAMAGVCIILALWSFVDVIRLSRSDSHQGISLKLPKSIRKRINRTISTKMRSSTLISSSFICGVIIALLESLCTGQVYLPICMKIQSNPSMVAFIYLVLYNLMFILPLLVVFVLAYKGVTSKAITDYFNKNLLLSKLLMSLLFVVLAYALIVL